jgi:SAM-dependent methyltransferase
MVISTERADAGTREFRARMEARRAARYHEFFGPVTGGFLPVLASVAGPGAGGLAVDLGCGDGRLTDLLTGQGWFCVPLDRAHAAVRSGSTTVRRRGVVADAMSLPVRDGAVELVCGAFLTPHLPDLAHGFGEMRRALCAGGRVVLASWSAPASSPFNGLLVELIRSRCGPGDRAALDDSVRRADPDHLGRLLEGAGFAGPRADVVRTEVSLDSAQEWWDGLTQGSEAIGFLVQRCTPDDRAAVRREFFAEAAKLSHNAALRVTAEAFVVSATAT